MLVTHYQVFPYQQLKALKQRFFPDLSLIQNTIANSDYYERQLSQHRYLANKGYDIVFLGDSLTDEADWQSFFTNEQMPIAIANFGIKGDTSAGVINRLDTVYATGAKKVFLMIGVNDLLQGKSVNVLFENYRSIVEQLNNNDLQVYIQSCLLVGPRYQFFNQRVNELNRRLQQIAEQNDAVVYIDLNQGLADGSLLNSRYTTDDIHLNAEGYNVWVDLIKSDVLTEL